MISNLLRAADGLGAKGVRGQGAQRPQRVGLYVAGILAGDVQHAAHVLVVQEGARCVNQSISRIQSRSKKTKNE